MRFEFHVVDGPNVGRRFFMDPKSEMTLGRTDRADLVFASDGRMSSLHAKLQADHADCHINDLGSTNGTFVNGRRINQTALAGGDAFTAGDTVIEFQVNHQSPPRGRQQQAPGPQADVRKTAVCPPPTMTVHREEIPSQAEVAWFLDMDGPTGRRTVSLIPEKSLVLGRTDPADISVPDEMISSVHLSLTQQGDELQVKDLGSSNGTFMHGQRITAVTLRSGDEFVAGRTTFRCRLQGASSAESEIGGDADTSHGRAEIVHDAPREQESLPESASLAMEPQATPQEPACVESEIAAYSPPDLEPGNHEVETLVSIGDAPNAVAFSYRSIKSKWPFALGLQDDDQGVRSAALLAAVFTRQPWLLDLCRFTAQQPDAQHVAELTLLAILGDESDLPLFRNMATVTSLGAARFRLVGTFGHPQIVDVLLQEFEFSEAATMPAVVRAFTKISGLQIESDRQPTRDLHPDLTSVRTQWSELASKFDGAHRVSCGFVIDPTVIAGAPGPLDMESQLESQVREIYFGRREPSAESLFLASRYLERATSVS